jgi:hypothetical protein
VTDRPSPGAIVRGAPRARGRRPRAGRCRPCAGRCRRPRRAAARRPARRRREPLLGEGAGIGLRKGDTALREAFDRALAALDADAPLRRPMPAPSPSSGSPAGTSPTRRQQASPSGREQRVPGAEIRTFDTLADATLDLRAGRVDLVLGDPAGPQVQGRVGEGVEGADLGARHPLLQEGDLRPRDPGPAGRPGRPGARRQARAHHLPLPARGRGLLPPRAAARRPARRRRGGSRPRPRAGRGRW